MSGIAGTSARDTEVRLPRATKVKNKQPASQQITAEQILREARELQDQDFKAPKQKITDETELAEYRLRKRKEFEDLVRRVRWNSSVWVKYAQWEEGQKDFRRARSVWERALDVSYTNPSTWLKYAEMEMRHRFINHARNVWDRAVSLLPRVDQLWYKYIHMEEMLGNVPGARQIYERWMSFEPDHHGWMSYIKMEMRYKEVDRARNIFERYVRCIPTVKSYVRYAKFEMRNGDVVRSRRCYERAVEELGEDAQTEELFIKFAEFEERCKEHDRARAIYRYALDHIPKNQADAVYQRFVAFEKQHGDREGIEDVIVSERRFQYEADVKQDPLNYDSWFDYVRLEEAAGQPDRVREVYERAIANVPPAPEKRYWQRYIYLWIKYALWEELEAEDADRARQVYRACLNLIPHSIFTFAKIWIYAANFEIRQKSLTAARKLLGTAIGMCPNNKLFRSYIELELQLGEIERVRTLYQKYLQWAPANCGAWCKYAEVEQSLGELARVRAIYELAIEQPVLDMPEVLWKSYIDFEIGEGERKNTRELYERLLQRTHHVKVWMSYADFEGAPMPEPEDEEEDPQAAAARAQAAQSGPESAASREACARSVYERAFTSLRESQPDAKEEAVMLLEAWRSAEAQAESVSEEARAAAVQAVEKRMPKRIKRKRPITTEDGLEVGMEEYFDYIFPDEAAAAPNLKLLEAAQRWKRQKVMENGS
ncbi:g3611 [Coccomyxa viridis]|uniref:G3611 protein n=1 Tax=Coccomyxa viridis TaxID=1274662 RepID=A0ABP1FN83_9CHLO